MMLVPLHAQLDDYENGGITSYYALLIVIPKNDASITRCLMGRDPDGEVRVVAVHQGGFGLDVHFRDLLLISLFQYFQGKMRRNGGTGFDWWTTSLGHLLHKKIGESDAASIINVMTALVLPESNLTEHSVTRLSRW